MLFLIPTNCLRCIIIGYSKWGRFGAILNSFTLSFVLFDVLWYSTRENEPRVTAANV